MKVNIEVLYNDESKRYIGLNNTTKRTKVLSRVGARAVLDLTEGVLKTFKNRKEIDEYIAYSE